MTKISVVTRHFQKGAEAQDYKKTEFQEKFKRDFLTPLDNLTRDSKNIEKVIVVFAGDQKSKYCEKYNSENEKPASYSCLEELTKSAENPNGWKINGIDIVPVICTDWGLNAGSATAINDGLAQVETELVLVWSKEMQLTSKNIDEAISLLNKKDLGLLGFLREGWEKENNAWDYPQNTAAIWVMKYLKEIEYFSRICNGIEGKEIEIETEFEKKMVLVAGMEDVEALIRILKIYPEFRYAMIGKDNPIVCTHGKKEYDLGERKRDAEKKARQPKVVEEYLNMHYPNGEKNSDFLKDIKKY